jgi:hypothetical protein
MIANFHTHTPRCCHASGTEEEYVRCALNAGLQTLGFSDHTPYPFPNGYYSTFRMFPDELPGYVAAVEDVRKRFAGQLQIHLGVEAEYYPKYFKDMPLDLIVSGHAHGGQWRFFGRGVYAPGQGILPKYTSGLHDGRFIVCRGLGNPHLVPRINNKPEIIEIDIKTSRKKGEPII